MRLYAPEERPPRSSRSAERSSPATTRSSATPVSTTTTSWSSRRQSTPITSAPSRSSTTSTKWSIGWIGSNTTAPYLKMVEPALQELERRYPQVELRIVGGSFQPPGLERVSVRRWGLELRAARAARFRHRDHADAGHRVDPRQVRFQDPVLHERGPAVGLVAGRHHYRHHSGRYQRLPGLDHRRVGRASGPADRRLTAAAASAWPAAATVEEKFSFTPRPPDS